MTVKTTLLCCFLATKLVAQTLQLPLNQARFTSTTGLIETGKDSFLYSSAIIPPTFFGGGKTNNLTQISLSKGVVWSIDFQPPRTTVPSKLTPCKEGFLWGSFVFDGSQNKSLMRLDKNGTVLWSKRYGGTNDIDSVNGGNVEAIVLSDGNFALAGGAARFAATTKNNDLFLAKLDVGGNQVWAKNYLFSNLLNAYTSFSNVIATLDGGFLLCGSVYTPQDRSILLLKTDASGTIQWTRTYANETGSFLSDELGVQVVQQPDGNFFLVANQKDFNQNSGNIVALINASGTVLRALRVSVNPGSRYTLQANKMILDAATNTFTVAAGVVQDSIPNLSIEQNLLYKIRLDGSLDWKYNYFDEISAGFVTPESDVVPTRNGGLAHLTSFSQNFDNLYPILIVSDGKGLTGCEKPINLVVERNIVLTSKTLTITERTALPAVNYAVPQTPFNFAVKLPTLDLGKDIATCAADTSVTFNATNPDFNTYKWSTGATTPQITANQLGQYALTVTNTAFCLTLADTVTVVKSTQCPDNEFKLDIANAFTPNNDGLNDTFGPFGKGFNIVSFQIYNRWGNLVFEGNDTTRSWNDQIKNENAASDVYVYALKYVTKGQEQRLSGEVTLIR
jgi:gliding motility-associated-like protein